MNTTQVAAVFKTIDREIWIVTATDGAQRSGLVATFVAPASIVPECPRILVGLAKSHFTWQLVEGSGTFAMHLISEEQLDWVWRFGLQSGRNIDKFEGLATRVGLTGSPILEEAMACFECRVETSLDIGDRSVYLGEVVEATVSDHLLPLTIHRAIERARPDQLQQLQSQLKNDAALDALSIRDWRHSRGKKS